MTPRRLYHGGKPDLRVGDLITPGHTRPTHDGCPWCQARTQQANGATPPTIDPLPQHTDRVYATPSRAYARYHASLYGRGDLYQITPNGELTRSTEDTIETWTAPTLTITAVIERAILLTWKQRRALYREWEQADTQWHQTHDSQPKPDETSDNT
jgi:hypothetical protein